MPNFKVTRGSGLDLFLRGKGYQQWRIVALVKCGGVKILRGGAEIPLKHAEKTHVDVDDIVQDTDFPPLSGACAETLGKEIRTNSHDYSFVPGQTGPEKDNAALLHARPKTIVFNDRLSKNPSVHDPLVSDDLISFIQALERSPVIIHPIRNLIVISHSTPEGHLSLKMGSDTDITYEVLESVVKSKAIVVKEHWLLPRPSDTKGADVPVQFIFGGCRIGTQRVFMKKLKEALGGKITVIAPKHFHRVASFAKPPGFIEFMAYSFRINRPQQLKTKEAVIQEMINEGFTTIDGSPVPNKAWQRWVPDRPEKTVFPNEQTFGEPVFNPITKSVVNARGFFRFFVRRLFKLKNRLEIKNDTGKEADRKKAIKEFLTERDDFKDTHPFPRYQRFGYNSMNEFMDGWAWEITPKQRATAIEWNATRHEYTAIPPITRGKKHELVLNFFPTTNKGTIIEMLKVDDTDFFEMV